MTPQLPKRKPPVRAPGKPARPAATPRNDEEYLRVLPSQLRPGDLVADDQGDLWEVSRPSSVYQAGKMHNVKMQKPRDPTMVWQNVWPAHVRIAIRRPRRASPARPEAAGEAR
jgi:hypothetical protein